MSRRTAFLIRSSGLVWNGIETEYAALPDVMVIGAATSAADARARVLALRPDIIVSGLEIDDASALPLLAELRAQLPEAIIILVGGRSVIDDGTSLAGVRATGFFLWDDLNHQDFPAAHQALRSGVFVVTSRTAARAFREAWMRRRHEIRLWDQERAVLRGLALGLSGKEIAERECMSLRTVERAIGDLKAKLDAPTLFILGMKASRLGLVR